MVFVIGNHDGKGIMLDPTHLRSFLAVTRTRNFSEAARRLGLRWPGLSELSNQFDPRAMPGRGGQTPVARQKRCVQRLGQRDVNSVVCREVVPQRPDPRQQKIVRVTPYRKIGEVVQRRAPARVIDLPARGVTAENLRALDIDQMRRVKGQAGGEQTVFHGRGRIGAQQHLDQRRGVHNDHARSRSARTASAGGKAGSTADRPARRERNSASVG